MSERKNVSERLNRELIERTAKWIEENPGHYEQANWGIRYNNKEYPENSAHEFLYRVHLSCDSPCCIAAHFVTLGMYSNPNDIPDSPEWPLYEDAGKSHYYLGDLATHTAGLSYAAANFLFGGLWPEEWLNNGKYPLCIDEESRNGGWIEPTPSDAVHVLRRLAKYGFEDNRTKERENE